VAEGSESGGLLARSESGMAPACDKGGRGALRSLGVSLWAIRLMFDISLQRARASTPALPWCAASDYLAVVIEPWVRDPRIGSEQCFTNILELLSRRQAGFESSFHIAVFTGRNDYLQMAGDIADHSLDRIERGTAHEPVLDMPSG